MESSYLSSSYPLILFCTEIGFRVISRKFVNLEKKMVENLLIEIQVKGAVMMSGEWCICVSVLFFWFSGSVIFLARSYVAFKYN